MARSSARYWCSCRRAWPSRRISPASFSISVPASTGTSSVSRGTGAGSPMKSTRCWRGSASRASLPTQPSCPAQPNLAAGRGYATTVCTARPACTTPPIRPRPLTRSRSGWRVAMAKPVTMARTATTVRHSVHLRQHRRGRGHARCDDTPDILPRAAQGVPPTGARLCRHSWRNNGLVSHRLKSICIASRACPALRLLLPGVAAGPRRHTGRQAVALATAASQACGQEARPRAIRCILHPWSPLAAGWHAGSRLGRCGALALCCGDRLGSAGEADLPAQCASAW